ncbi:MAG: MarR family transcriptional regulator [Sedimentisphaerales bacterium]|nr:MarR family transcriptional regulator [Sedimentisphaerales bacterium]
MALKEELGLKRGFADTAHEAILNIYFTASIMKKRADDFFEQFGLTDVQFNLMDLLRYQSGKEGGLSQAQLSDMMLVNRANITSLVDRMEKINIVVRTPHSNDRRFNIIKLTSKGAKLFAKVEPHYIEQIHKAMSSLEEPEFKKLMTMLEKVRETLHI